jgi:glutathione S-transferase
MTAAAPPIRAGPGADIFWPRRALAFRPNKSTSARCNTGAAYSAINPMQRLPALALDDGTAIAESIAICRYFEALHPDPPLFGRGALDTASVEMWNRRVELSVPTGNNRVPASASVHEGVGRSAGAGMGRSQQAAHRRLLKFLDGELESRPYVAGNSSTANSRVGPMSPARSSPLPTSLRWSQSIS